MRILICSEEAPLPPVNGMRLVVGTLVEHLSGSHDVHVVAYRKPDQPRDAAGAPAIMSLAEQPARSRAAQVRSAGRFAVGQPWFVEEDARPMRALLREELERFQPDVVQVFSPRLAPVAPVLGGLPSVLSVLDAWHRNVEAQALVAAGLRRRVFRAQARRVRRFEAHAYRPFDRVVVVTEQDRRALHELDPELKVTVIPNGVDLERFSAPVQHREPARLIFHGSLDYAPNVAAAEFAAREILPLVRDVQPDAELVLVGRSPSQRVLALDALPGVRVVGEVPEVGSWLAGSTAYLCPMLSGTGIKNKLLEAMASGLPCVVTPLALQGMTARADTHVLLGESAPVLAERAVRLLTDPELARQLGTRARALVRDEHTWGAAVAAYERIYRDLVEVHPPIPDKSP